MPAISAVLIFLICYMLDQIWMLCLKEPPLWLFRLVTWVVGLVLILVLSFGPIRLG